MKTNFSLSNARARGLLASMLSLIVFGCAQTPPAPPPTAAPDSSIGPAAIPNAPPAATAPSTPPAVAVAPVQPALPGALPKSARGPDARSVATVAALTPSGKTRYQCEVGGSKNAIALPEGTDRICSRFPAMGPCQYERDACRAKGGRVIRFDDVEITKEVEHEYDKQVQRFKLNAG